jgi:SNF2 family DNA or RNA helicase
MISNGPALVNMPGDSSKEEEFLRLMKEELLTEKVILFTRFKSGIPRLEVLCERSGIKYVKITGDQNDKERQSARLTFMNDSTCNLIFITTAGSASLNLQAAGAIIFYDTPWSYGDLVQTIGRAQRIGSIQDHILIIHFVNKGTIDVRVMGKVSDKKELSDQILGDTAAGALDFTSNEDKVLDGLYSDLLKDAETF